LAPERQIFDRAVILVQGPHTSRVVLIASVWPPPAKTKGGVNNLGIMDQERRDRLSGGIITVGGGRASLKRPSRPHWSKGVSRRSNGDTVRRHGLMIFNRFTTGPL
jgi:hypothetical protein